MSEQPWPALQEPTPKGSGQGESSVNPLLISVAFTGKLLIINTLTLLLRGYHLFISPFLHVIAGPGGGCRFEPTCSQYAIKALRTWGPWRGSALAFRRVCKCHPWGRCGFDPVPPLPNLNSESHGS